MRPLWRIFMLIWRAERSALLRGIALSVVVLAMGVALLGLSGWFIVAAGAAGLAGAGAVFDVFRPSAGVRFLALGRTAARYGERLLTHDATLKSLTALRSRLLAAISAADFPKTSRFRGAQILNRLTADVDALDGVALRLVIPILAGLATLAGVWLVLSWLVDPAVATWSILSLLAGSSSALVWAARRSVRASRLGAAAAQAFRVRLIDHLRGRAMLALSGRLESDAARVLDADARARGRQLALARVERRTGALLSATATLSATGALLIGAVLARSGALSPALAGLGFLATLALAETVAPLRRAMGELGAMRDAARRVNRWLDEPPAPPAALSVRPDPAKGLELSGVTLTAPGAARPVVEDVCLKVAPGETLALTGRSGAGKSTLLNAAAGLVPPARGTILLAGHPLNDWPERDLRGWLGYLPQRCALVSGTVAENLRLGAPAATDAMLQRVLALVALDSVVDRLGGLDAAVGEAGRGLSGGEMRRLALARMLLREPKVLLLDEPTEGLDRRTGQTVLDGIRRACPDAAILLVAHRAVERDWATARLELSAAPPTA